MQTNSGKPTDAACGGRSRKYLTDPETTARCSGLRYLMDDKPGYSRKKSGTYYSYYDTRNRLIKDEAVISRINALVIPPAWKDVWISPYEDSHLQVTGVDARGRKQYRYHEKWRVARDQSKYEKMISFARCLPRIRERVQEDLQKAGLPREKVLATVVRLLEATCIRVGNESYARDNDSYGLTTMRNRHVKVRKCDITFKFLGKSGKEHNISLTDCALADIVKHCRARSGDLLFQYVDEQGAERNVTSTDVNRYLREVSGQSITAKDFRTWWGTVLAALALQQLPSPTSQATARRQISGVVKEVSQVLGNTPSVCRKCYIHPAVMTAFAEGRSPGKLKKSKPPDKRNVTQLLPEEEAILRFLKQEWVSNRD